MTSSDVPLFTEMFYFVRHGETTYNAAGLISGQLDVPLNDLGRAQAEEAARRLAPFAVGSIVSSHLSRARETAEVIAAACGGLPVASVPDIEERHLGVWEGQPQAVLVRAEKPEGGEGPDDFHARAQAGLAAIRGKPPIVVVAHSGIFRVLRTHLCGGDVEEERIPNGHPVRMIPPEQTDEPWRFEIL